MPYPIGDVFAKLENGSVHLRERSLACYSIATIDCNEVRKLERLKVLSDEQIRGVIGWSANLELIVQKLLVGREDDFPIQITRIELDSIVDEFSCPEGGFGLSSDGRVARIDF
ncbi:hypothetical protein LQR31_11460 [Chromobacterium vaccinii]|uniref:hypothetical protein n=1 Tax=Chromobacterium vaccinii TaxID=1108595 RepID=UPI001E45EF41|nr:hypothetical protein [Chromobacterium vaccinii]MCD4485094.1 hypothetical protein [Chromobacterium vaccinii]